MTTTLSAQRNYPKTRPTTVGNSILTNGGFEDPISADLPTPPSILSISFQTFLMIHSTKMVTNLKKKKQVLLKLETMTKEENRLL